MTIPGLPPAPPGRTGWPWDCAGLPPSSSLVATEALPKISVITPSFNQGEYLEETIRSVLGQGYPNLEYLIIDGGSTDGSLEIIRKYEPWLTYWESAADRGQAHAINKGLDRCGGEILAYLNSDDVYLPDTFRIVAQAFGQNRDFDLVYGDCRILDSASQVQGHWRSRPFDAVVELCRNFIYQPTVFWRRRLRDRIGSFDEKLDYVMDIDYWYRALVEFKFQYQHRELACFRIHDRSKTGNQRARFIEERRGVIERVLRDAHEPSLREQQRRILAWHHFHAGEQLYHAGDLRAAEQEFISSVRLTPWSVRIFYVMLARLDVLLNTRLFNFLQRLHACAP